MKVQSKMATIPSGNSGKNIFEAILGLVLDHDLLPLPFQFSTF